MSRRSMASRLRRLVVPLLAAGLVLAGCDEGGDGPTASLAPATGGLVVLAGSTTATSLRTWDAAGRASDLAVPDPTAAWLSAGRRGTLLATLADGTLRLSDRLPLDPGASPGWRAVPSPDADLPAEPLRFASWSPSGLVAAAIASDATGTRSLVLIDPVGNSTLTIDLAGGPLSGAPAWLDDDRVIVPGGERVSIVDTTTVASSPGPAGAAQVAISADGQRIAVWPGTGTVEVRRTAEWLAGAGQPEAVIEPAGVHMASMALDRRGERLALLWERDSIAGRTAGRVVILRRDGESWREVEAFDLPGGEPRGVVTWLP